MLSFLFFSLVFSLSSNALPSDIQKNNSTAQNQTTDENITNQIQELLLTVQYLRSEVADIYKTLVITSLSQEIKYLRQFAPKYYHHGFNPRAQTFGKARRPNGRVQNKIFATRGENRKHSPNLFSTLYPVIPSPYPSFKKDWMNSYPLQKSSMESYITELGTHVNQSLPINHTYVTENATCKSSQLIGSRPPKDNFSSNYRNGPIIEIRPSIIHHSPQKNSTILRSKIMPPQLGSSAILGSRLNQWRNSPNGFSSKISKSPFQTNIQTPQFHLHRGSARPVSYYGLTNGRLAHLRPRPN